jgi:predicted nucleic acid-binding protein
MYFLDTSTILELIYGSTQGAHIQKLTHGLPITISALSVHELLVGLKENEVEKISQFLKEVSVINYDGKSALKKGNIEKELRSKGKLINRMDILIAGTCLVHNYHLITCDSDFKKIKDLSVTFC